jgi:predicted Zn-dependent protease
MRAASKPPTARLRAGAAPGARRRGLGVGTDHRRHHAIGDHVRVKRTIARLSLALGAAAVAAWFALGWIQARDTGRAQGIVSTTRLTSSQVRSAQSLLGTAATLNPDRSVDEARAQLASDQHDYGRAISILKSVTRAEPLNLGAWAALSVAAERSKRIWVAVAALRHIHQLLGHPK